jgi:hypothetical protein
VQNKTTIEHLEGVTAHAHYRHLGQRFSHPYDVGAAANIRAVLGPRWWRWCFPGVAAYGSGVAFPGSLPPAALRTLREEQQRGEASPAQVQLSVGALSSRQHGEA